MLEWTGFTDIFLGYGLQTKSCGSLSISVFGIFQPIILRGASLNDSPKNLLQLLTKSGFGGSSSQLE